MDGGRRGRLVEVVSYHRDFWPTSPVRCTKADTPTKPKRIFDF